MPDYSSLEPAERLRLVVSALARQDGDEARYLYESCPDHSLEHLDSALDKVIGFLILNLLMAERRQAKARTRDPAAAQAIANLLAAAQAFCAEIGIPLAQLAIISQQLGELIASLSPLGDVPPDRERVAELTGILKDCWTAAE